MYENQTDEVILKRMMEAVPASIDKREGSIVFDSCKPAAIEAMLLYAMADYFLKNTFGDTADREWLVERARERGLSPYPATFAKCKGMFTPITLNIPIGTRFSYDDVNYAVTEKIGGGIYFLSCETIGPAGNKPIGSMIPIDYVAGLQTAVLSEVTVPGESEEETEAFRKRYFDSFDPQAYGGNIADYREKVNAIPGVGGIKVYPAWQGGGTVRVVFMTSEFKVPTAEFIDEIQTKIDPIPNQGEGLGVAPIGHIVTVEGVNDSAVRIDLEMLFRGSYSFEDYRADIEKVIDEYFLSLNKKWQSTQIVEPGVFSNSGILIRKAVIESRLLDIEGAIDVLHIKLNGVEENLTLNPDALAVRGLVNGS